MVTLQITRIIIRISHNIKWQYVYNEVYILIYTYTYIYIRIRIRYILVCTQYNMHIDI